MKVLLAIPCLERGGTEMQTLNLAKALVLAGHSVKLACYFQYDEEVLSEFRQVCSEVFLLGLEKKDSAVLNIRRLANFFSSQKPDVIHVQYMNPGALPILAARIANVKKVIATVHQPYTEYHGLHAKLLLRSAAALCDYFISVSQVAEISWFGTRGEVRFENAKRFPKHFTLHNAVDKQLINRLVVDNQEQLSELIDKDKLQTGFVIGYVGRISREKGVDILLEAFARVVDDGLDVKLIVVGDGSELKQLKEKYDSDKFREKAFFMGLQNWENAVRFFSLFDVLVVPSRFEGFGLTALEGMASGVPVIASNTGGLSEIIESEKSGLLINNGDVEGFANAIKRIYKDEELRGRLSRNAEKRAAEFDIDLYNDKIVKFYNNI
jgi:glycosyltransferase involved in cell wall biosynthesis